ncbi:MULTISPECIES: hypothetical protein [Proteus]|uniref:hypothetical protein n=1 Tax=Proteus TaxID=583 RepID=UPI000B003683|nr:hypothetical protein [Proteus vulgaris]
MWRNYINFKLIGEVYQDKLKPPFGLEAGGCIDGREYNWISKPIYKALDMACGT